MEEIVTASGTCDECWTGIWRIESDKGEEYKVWWSHENAERDADHEARLEEGSVNFIPGPLL